MAENDNDYILKLRIVAENDQKALESAINETKRQLSKLQSWMDNVGDRSADSRKVQAKIDSLNNKLAKQQAQLAKTKAKYEAMSIKQEEKTKQQSIKLEEKKNKESISLAQKNLKEKQKLENEALKRKEQALQQQLKAELKYQQELQKGNARTQAAAKKQLDVAKGRNSAASRQVNTVYRQTGDEDFLNASNSLVSDYKLEKQYQLEKLNLQNQINQKVQEEAALRQMQNQSYQQQKSLINDIQNNEKQILSLGEQRGSQNKKEINELKEKTLSQIQELKAIQQMVPLNREQAKAIEDAGAKQKKLTEEAQKTANKMRDASSGAKSFGEYLKNVGNYVLLYNLLNAIQQAVRNAYEVILELDTAFTDIQMVTGYNEEQIGDLSLEYNDLAKQMGATTQEVAEGATEWLRQGKSIEETTELLKSSMTLAKVGAIESSEATQLLTSTLNGYKMSAEEAMGVVDKVSAIDMAAATSSEELMTALSRTANSADDAGISFDKLLAMIGTVSSVTRKSASTIGESFKTIFSRMSNVAAGKDIDEEGESLNDVETTLNKMGITLRDSQDEWRNFEDVIDEVAEKWKGFSSTQQSQIATAIAGKGKLPCARTRLKNVA